MISPVGAVTMRTSVNYILPQKSVVTHKMISPVPEEKTVGSAQALLQMPNISFKAINASSACDVMVYDSEGKKRYMSEHDQRILRLSTSASQDIMNGDNIIAIRKLLCVADIYRELGRLDMEATIIDNIRKICDNLSSEERANVFKISNL